MAVATNYFEGELLQDLDNEIRAGAISIGPDSAEYFSKLAACYPVLGSKIQWSKVPSSIEQSEPLDDLQEKAFSDFFGRMITLHKLSGPAIYMGDSAVNFALLSSVEEFSRKLSVLLQIPQHHYFVARDFSWCIVFSLEGDMSFGYRPV